MTVVDPLMLVAEAQPSLSDPHAEKPKQSGLEMLSNKEGFKHPFEKASNIAIFQFVVINLAFLTYF